jgi:hypothetical protein
MTYPLTLPPHHLIAQANQVLKNDYTIQCQENLLDFTIRDPRGADIAEYSAGLESLMFGFILAEWCVDDDSPPIDEVLSDMHDYVSDFFRQMNGGLQYTVDEVSDVSMDKESVAIEVIYSTPCHHIKDLLTAMESHRQVVLDLASPDWLP